MTSGKRFRGIDHVELYVPARREAAHWYAEVLDFEVVAEYEAWAEDPRGPLMISNDGGRTKLALFRGPAQGKVEERGWNRVAVGTDGAGFLDFLGRLASLGLTDRRGRQVTPDLVSDHDRAFSVYFTDPWGNSLELTTYDHAHVAAGLGGMAGT